MDPPGGVPECGPGRAVTDGAGQNRAKAVCAGCPVRTECLAQALDSRIEHGIWGGMTERERRALLKRRPTVGSWRNLLEAARAEHERRTEPARPDGIPAADVADFERAMHEILTSWQLPGTSRVTYDQKTAEISVDGSARGSRGRGMRSVIHAAFTMALARYTAERDLPHPGFVVLDSPLLAYREPDEDFVMPRNVAGHFFQSLHSDFGVQVIVAENVKLPEGLGEHATLHPFSVSGTERVGFYPVPTSAG